MITPHLSSYDKLLDEASAVIASRGGIGSSDASRSDLRSKRSIDLCRETLRAAGRSVTGDDESDALEFLKTGGLATRTMVADGSVNQSGDHPFLVDNLANKVLQDPAPIADIHFEQWAGRLEDAKDFGLQSVGEVGMFTTLDLFTEEDDETTELKFDSKLKTYYKVDRFRNKVGLTVEMIVGDKLGGFARQLASLRNAGRLKLNKMCLDVLALNPTLPDGIPMFHASHNNLVTTGAGPNHDQLQAMRTMHRKQTAYTGEDRPPEPMGIGPRLALVPSKWETLARQTMYNNVADVKVPNTDDNINTVAGEVAPLPEIRLDDYDADAWYTSIGNDFGEFNVGYAYQRGYGRDGRRTTWFSNESTKRFVAFESRFAAAAVGYRSMVKNPGL